LPEGQDWLREIASRLVEVSPQADTDAEVIAESADAVLQAAGRLLQQRRSRVDSGEATPLLDLLRRDLSDTGDEADAAATDSNQPERRGVFGNRQRLRLFRLPAESPGGSRPPARDLPAEDPSGKGPSRNSGPVSPPARGREF
jgi:hypothetical protein